MFKNPVSHIRGIGEFGALWLVLFLIYLPATQAGFVVDFTGWLDQVKNAPFPEYINRTNFSVNSLYQFTQLISWLLYKLIGVNAFAWHIIFICLQALNATLLYSLVVRVGLKMDIDRIRPAAFSGSILFSLSPYLSEVIVWEPSLHYLLAFFMILTILHLATRYLESGKIRHAGQACLIFILSLFSLEYFYLSPLLVLSLAALWLYGAPRKEIMRFFLYFLIPFILLICLRLLLFKVLYADWVSRIGEGAFRQEGFVYFIKPLKYLFHVFFLGRFWPDEVRKAAYQLCESPVFVYFIYTIFIIISILYFRRFKRLSGRIRLSGLLFLWTGLACLLVSPMWFHEDMLVKGDRYGYLVVAFGFMFLGILLSNTPRRLRVFFFVVFAGFNLGYTLKVNRLWYLSAKINKQLLEGLPKPNGRTVILLNLPECMNGVPMIQACTHGEFKLMYNLLYPEDSLHEKVYDIASFNMNTYWDGAHVNVLNDSSVRVSLNQWGTWWWQNGRGAVDIDNEDFHLEIKDIGHWYDISLKHPKENYLLLYLNDGHWKEVDMGTIWHEQY